jgi:hypothetical protein
MARPGTFKPGHSANPGGRPKGVIEVIHLARQQTTAAIRTLVEILKNGQSEQARIAAANALLDRGWGKAPQSITIDDQRDAASYSDRELEDAIRAVEQKFSASGEDGEVAPQVPHKPSSVVH